MMVVEPLLDAIPPLGMKLDEKPCPGPGRSTWRGASHSVQVNYGADLTPRQYVQVVLALVAGTCLEWYDFGVYAALSTVLTKLFFPTGNPAVERLSFFAVFAVGYIARPMGSIIFGHIGDSRGRRTTLLISVLTVTLPTILMGCLPTYEMVGLAAPLLMALLRLIQGLAVGGEFGSAMVYLYEIAPKHRKGLLTAVGDASSLGGIIAASFVVLAVTSACSQEQMLLFGWRIPFLLVALTAPAALVLRLHMPETREFLLHRNLLVQERVAHLAAGRVVRSVSKQQHSTNATPSQLRRQLQQQGSAIFTQALGRRCSADGGLREGEVAPSRSGWAGAAASAPPAVAAAAPAVAAGAPPMASPAVAAAAAGGRGCASSSHQVRPLELHLPTGKSPAGPSDPQGSSLGLTAALPPELTAQLSCEVEAVSQLVKHHVPIKVLFRDHWVSLLSHWMLLAFLASSFYSWFSFYPAWLVSNKVLTESSSLWIGILSMVVYMVGAPLGGLASDRGARKCWVYMALLPITAAVGVVLAVGVTRGCSPCVWVLQPLMLGLLGFMAGVSDSIGNQVYAPGVRTSGFNLAYSLAMGIIGGLTPLMASGLALRLPVGVEAFSASIVVCIIAVPSLAAAVTIIWQLPEVNATNSVELLALKLQQQQQQQGHRGGSQQC